MRRRITPARAGLNITPMIDVVFQLLIYFLVATNFALGEQVFRLDLPDRGGVSSNRDPFELDEEPLRIRVRSSGEDGQVIALSIEGPYPQPEDLEDLENYLARSLERSGSALFMDDHPVVIVPGPDTRWEHVVATFNAAVRAGFRSVVFAPPESS
ncbi:MAG: biopolymer transporter ExbD [Phycisphaerales bacterium]|nr:biopolymer transporter ExbD [Phycisphaerales bacterium]